MAAAAVAADDDDAIREVTTKEDFDRVFRTRLKTSQTLLVKTAVGDFELAPRVHEFANDDGYDGKWIAKAAVRDYISPHAAALEAVRALRFLASLRHTANRALEFHSMIDDEYRFSFMLRLYTTSDESIDWTTDDFVEEVQRFVDIQANFTIFEWALPATSAALDVVTPDENLLVEYFLVKFQSSWRVVFPFTLVNIRRNLRPPQFLGFHAALVTQLLADQKSELGKAAKICRPVSLTPTSASHEVEVLREFPITLDALQALNWTVSEFWSAGPQSHHANFGMFIDRACAILDRATNPATRRFPLANNAPAWLRTKLQRYEHKEMAVQAVFAVNFLVDGRLRLWAAYEFPADEVGTAPAYIPWFGTTAGAAHPSLPAVGAADMQLPNDFRAATADSHLFTSALIADNIQRTLARQPVRILINLRIRHQRAKARRDMLALMSGLT